MLPATTLKAPLLSSADGGGDAFSAALTGAHESAMSPFNALPKPTAEQAQADDYRKGRIVVQGLPICIENPAGTVREGTSPGGTPWRSLMTAAYGYFEGTTGADGDGIDCFVGPFPESPEVHVINQRAADGAWDEHKVMVGFADRAAAVAAYKASYGADADKFFTEPVSMSMDKFKEWIMSGNTTIALHPEQDIDGTTGLALDRVFWRPDATPGAGQTLDEVLYAIRRSDALEGLVFDSMTMADVLDGVEVMVLDALVTMAGRLQPKMMAMQRIMEAAGGPVTPLSFQISEPVKRFGGVHVAVIFELSDGQTLTVWFHNPDSTPNKISPADDLVSWKWQLNKKDVTIVVAPENGTDLNMREAARRIMRVAAKNSAAFIKANATRAAAVAEIATLKVELSDKQGVLKGLHQDIEIARAEADDRAAKLAAGPAWKQPDFDPTTPENYALLSEFGEEAWLANQDALDSFFQGRLIEVRNALRGMGWDGERFKPLSKEGYTLKMNFTQVGAGANIVGESFEIEGVPGFFMSDDLTRTPEDLAAGIDSGMTSYAANKRAQDESMAQAQQAAKAAGYALGQEVGKAGGSSVPTDSEAFNAGMKEYEASPAVGEWFRSGWVDGWDAGIAEFNAAADAEKAQAAAYAADVEASMQRLKELGWTDNDGKLTRTIGALTAYAREEAGFVIASDGTTKIAFESFAEAGGGAAAADVVNAGVEAWAAANQPKPEPPEKRRVVVPGGLSLAEMTVLLATAAYKSFARFTNANNDTGISQEAYERAKMVLEEKGMLSRGAMTRLGQGPVDAIKAMVYPSAQFATAGDVLKEMAGVLGPVNRNYARENIEFVGAEAPPITTEDPSDQNYQFLSAVAAGKSDAEDLGVLLQKITAAVNALNESGGLVGAADTAANNAITHWVELDAKVNG